MAKQFAGGIASGVLRMCAIDGGWTPVHVTVNRVELEENTFAGLVVLREPTEQEIADAELGQRQI